MHVMYVGGLSVISGVLKNVREITIERKPKNVKNVGKHFVLQLHCKYMNPHRRETLSK